MLACLGGGKPEFLLRLRRHRHGDRIDLAEQILEARECPYVVLGGNRLRRSRRASPDADNARIRCPQQAGKVHVARPERSADDAETKTHRPRHLMIAATLRSGQGRVKRAA